MRKLQHTRSCLSTLTIALTAFLSLASCSDDDEPSFVPNLPLNGGNYVKSITRTGDITSTSYDWDFGYGFGPRIANATGTMRDPKSDVDKSYIYTSSIYYGDRSVSVQNSSGENINIILNGSNFIEQMDAGNSRYQFYYDGGHMIGWKKILSENSFGQIAQHESSAILRYDEEFDLKYIEYTDSHHEKTTTYFTPDKNYKNKNGLLPEGVGKEMGCLGFEHLYYAGLLGLPTKNVIKRIIKPNALDTTKIDTLNFEYGPREPKENEDITACMYRNPLGGFTSVAYKY